MSGPWAGFLVEIGEARQLSLGGLAVEVKVRADQAAGQLTIMGMTVDPHRLVPPHIHADEDEYTYVVAGTIGARIGDEEFEAGPGCYLIKPRRVAHAFWNPADTPAKTVEIVAPGGFEAFFEDLAEAATTGDARRVRQRRADLAIRHRLDYLTELIPALKAKYGLKLIGE